MVHPTSSWMCTEIEGPLRINRINHTIDVDIIGQGSLSTDNECFLLKQWHHLCFDASSSHTLDWLYMQCNMGWMYLVYHPIYKLPLTLRKDIMHSYMKQSTIKPIKWSQHQHLTTTIKVISPPCYKLWLILSECVWNKDEIFKVSKMNSNRIQVTERWDMTKDQDGTRSRGNKKNASEDTNWLMLYCWKIFGYVNAWRRISTMILGGV